MLKKSFLPFIIFITIILGFLVWKTKPSHSDHLIATCHILDQDGKILRAYPGLFCDFFSNGDYIVSDGTEIQYLNKNDEVVWRKKLHVHHQLKISKDEQRILLISSGFEKQNQSDGHGY